jgi:hypothetical protein
VPHLWGSGFWPRNLLLESKLLHQGDEARVCAEWIEDAILAEPALPLRIGGVGPV